jgi:glucokinase
MIRNGCEREIERKGAYLSRLYVGVDLGGTNVRAGLVDEDGNVLARDRRKTLARESAEAPVRQIVDSIKEVVRHGKASLSDIAGIGIGSPGPLSAKEGKILKAGNLPHWENFPLAQVIRERTGVKTFIQNDANVFALGEWWKGAGRGYDNFFVMTLGTGIGGGAIVGGKLLTGFNDNAAEVGHTSVDFNGIQCWCGQKGCLEMYSSATGIVRVALEEVVNEHWNTPLSEYICKPGELNSYIIYEAAKNGDAFARHIFDKVGFILGVGIVNSLNLLNFERVALGGGMAMAGDLIFEPARRALRERGFRSFSHQVSIVPAEIPDDAAVLGSVKLVMGLI